MKLWNWICVSLVLISMSGCVGLAQRGPDGEPSMLEAGADVFREVSEQASEGDWLGVTLASVVGVGGLATLWWKKWRRKNKKSTTVPRILDDLDEGDVLEALEKALEVATRLGLVADIAKYQRMIEEEKARRAAATDAES